MSFVNIKFARQLERELATALARAETAEKERDTWREASLRLSEDRVELRTKLDAQKQPLAQSESLALKWMNEALDLRAKLAAAERDSTRVLADAYRQIDDLREKGDHQP